ncbi:ATP-binding cassette domain-containing protein [Nocardioides sp. zg-579]|uniref:ATP-binding cassette domain-containing protein n=1 Tax=Nocardioides marmotae TaxID=2663857 RepID=A0A6I3JFP5_9ACTN|nr:ABC transporter ATP-binding protein [Nocardioides marmotae]MCR6033300.1 ATP-binding cassette domain-containing protein [Gordonia jinghuaiqii]MTB96957.1 ATP-binding cassette domain-containing protein [Nocardioides marmotae]QKE00661.1 ABC transporter ATP-binding protein [Nocardioides marmotae]
MNSTPPGPAVEVVGLRKAYGEKVAVADVGFTVEHGEVFGILGPNGAGKTTTVEAVAGMRVGDAGRIRVHGLDPWTERDALTRVLSIQLQESRLQAKITAQEAFELWSALYDDPVPWREVAERLGLTEHLGRRFGALSGGQQQRLSIALALVARPRVVVLDELSTGLDPRARRDVWQVVRDLRAGGTTVLLVTHSMEEAQSLCDRVAIIDRGRIRALDTPEGLIRAAGEATTMTFVPSTPIDLDAVRDLPGVTEVRAEGGLVVVTGAEDAAVTVVTDLVARGVVPTRLNVTAGSLDSAYLDLTAAPDQVETPA